MFRVCGAPTGLMFNIVSQRLNLNTGTALRSREQGAHRTLLEAGRNGAQFSHSLPRMGVPSLSNQFDLTGGKQITLMDMSVEAAHLRRSFVLDMFFYVM